MLNYERDGLAVGSIDYIEILSQDGDLVEHDDQHPPIYQGPFAQGGTPLVWQWTLQDREGRIWTELVDVVDVSDYPPVEDRDEVLYQKLVADFESDRLELEQDLAENG